MSRGRSGRWRGVVVELVWPGLLLGLGVAGWSQGAPVGVLALGAGLVAAGFAATGLVGDGRRTGWKALCRACVLTGSLILVAAAFGQSGGDMLRAVVVGALTAVAVEVWEHPRVEAKRARQPRLRSQDDFGPIRGRVQAWWDRERYRGTPRRSARDPFGR